MDTIDNVRTGDVILISQNVGKDTGRYVGKVEYIEFIGDEFTIYVEWYIYVNGPHHYAKMPRGLFLSSAITDITVL